MFNRIIQEGKPCPLNSIPIGQEPLSGRVNHEYGGFITLQYAMVARLENIHFDMPGYIKERLSSYNARPCPNYDSFFGLGIAFKANPQEDLYDGVFRKVLGQTVAAFDPYITFLVNDEQNQMWIGHLDTLGRLLEHLDKTETKARIENAANAAYGRLIWGHDTLHPRPDMPAP